MINQPIFCLTSDIEDANEASVGAFLELSQKLGVTPTIFASKDSALVRAYAQNQPTNIGLNPAFSGTGMAEVKASFEKLRAVYPAAKSFRAQDYFDSFTVSREASLQGMQYDSNLCLFLQPDIIPLQLGVPNLTRLPVFWDDRYHASHTQGDWQLSHFLDAFLSPGLKIINVHPAHSFAGALDSEPRKFVEELLTFLKSQNHQFLSLQNVYEHFPITSFLVSGDETKGKHTPHSNEEYQKYWAVSDTEKQNFLRESYQQRNARDKYATSRDYHVRELEISAIAKGLGSKGPIVDFGCGNGYTLLSLAKRLKGWDMVGVDFSDNLIEGAQYLVESEKAVLQSKPSFVCADAVKYIGGLKDGSVRYVITERFIQNLPSLAWQKDVVRQVYRILEKGGRYLMCEGSLAGHNALNNIRHKVGLEEIPETSADNISSIRIDDAEFEKFGAEIGFSMVQKHGFSDYFMMSRVLQPLMVAPLRPRFDSKMNDHARAIQENIEFRPGIGSNVLWVFEK